MFQKLYLIPIGRTPCSQPNPPSLDVQVIQSSYRSPPKFLMAPPLDASDNVSSNFKLVLPRFRLTLTPAEVDDFAFTRLEDVESALAEVQAQQARQKRYRCASRISIFLQAMKDYGAVVETFLNISNYVAFVWVWHLYHTISYIFLLFLISLSY